MHNAVTVFFEEVSNRQRLDQLDGLFVPGFAWHTPSNTLIRLEDIKGGFRRLFHAFPNMLFTPCDCLEMDGEAMVRWHGDGTHLGAYENIPPTGRLFHYEGIVIFRFSSTGQIAEVWMDSNLRTMLARLKQFSEGL